MVSVDEMREKNAKRLNANTTLYVYARTTATEDGLNAIAELASEKINKY